MSARELASSVDALAATLRGLVEVRTTDPGRGSLRAQAVAHARAIEPGAVDAERARELEALWRAAAMPFPCPTAVTRPNAAVGVTYWLSGHDADGLALRLRLERLALDRVRAGDGLWERFWPFADDRERRVENAFAHARRRLALAPAEPASGFHRITSADRARPDRVLEGLALRGASLVAPLALMFLSVWLDQPLDPTLASTGDIDDDGRLVLAAGLCRRFDR